MLMSRLSRMGRSSAANHPIFITGFFLTGIIVGHQFSEAAPPSAPQLPVFGFVPVVGENIGVPIYQHDDWGPPPEVLAGILRETGATCINVGGGGWRYAEPVDSGGDPSNYDWTVLDAMVEPWLIDGVLPIAYASFSDQPDWVTEPYGTPAYWAIAERYMQAYASHLNELGVYHFIFENEPNMLARPDWPDYHMERLRHGYTAIKAVNPANQVIAGNLSEDAAAAGHYDLLYDRGLKQYSDIIGLHPYSNDHNTGLDIGDAAITHQVMVNRGDGNKKMFLGEGWGPKRELPDFKRGSAADRPNRAEIDRLRAFMENGYHLLMTPSGNWDPNWLFGVLFFTLNDNLCCRHWAERATPVPGGCLIDGIFIEGCNLAIGHFNGGLVDMYANPKSDIIWGFPNGVYRPSPTPMPLPPTVGPNLVVNGDFEGGFQPNGVANGWHPYDTTLTGAWRPADISHSGSGAQSFGADGIGYDGGIVQAIPTAAGSWYALTAWITYQWYNLNNPDTVMTVGYDTSGQTSNPRALSSFWNIDFRDWNTPPNQWIKVEMLFQATGASTSIWFRGSQEWAAPWYFMIVDDVEVRECESPEDPTPTLTWTPTPTPTATFSPSFTPIPTDTPGPPGFLLFH